MATRRIKDPKIVRLDITPSWYWHREARSQLLPLAMLVFLQHDLRPCHRELRMHLNGVELEVLNVADKDVVELGSDLQSRLSALSTNPAWAHAQSA